MRLITGLILSMGIAGTALADSGHELSAAAISHHLFGLHHLPINLLLCVAAIYFFRRWQSSKRSN
jgi:predicted transporter